MERILTFGAAQEILKKVASLATQEFTMLRDAEQSQVWSEAVELWVKKLEDIAHDADDVLDEYGYEVLRRKVELRNQMKKKVLEFFSHHNPIAFRVQMAHKIKNINASLEKLNKMAASIGLVARSTLIADPTSSCDIGLLNSRETVSCFVQDEMFIVGRDEVASEIVTTLINSSNTQEMYHDSEIHRHFNKKIWICVSTNFEVKTILSMILEQLEQKKTGMYLLVLDDVWNEDSHKWNDLMSCLASVNDTQGSNILITSRSVTVASIVQALHRRDLGRLADDECWLILKDKAFPDGSASLTEDQERMAREIAKKCAGVPLVAKVLGNMMRCKMEYRILSVLRLSFDELKSASLKRCFAYCSMFIKGFKISKTDLIHLWMAHGLIQCPTPNQSNLEMEDVGNEYFNVLLENSFFQDVEVSRYSATTITHCKMHDIVHDLAEHVSTKSNESNEFRYVAQISTSMLQGIPKRGVHKLRSIFWNDISGTRIRMLPKSIGKLYNLLTLRMFRVEVEKFPKELLNLINLRHFYFKRDDEIYPVGVGQLTNLRSLPFFIVGKGRGRGIEELAGLKQLKGKLSIHNLENVRDGEEAKKAKLVEKTNINKLFLAWGGDRLRIKINDEDVLEGLQLPRTKLEYLEIRNFMGEKFASWMIGSPFPALKRLSIHGAKNLIEWMEAAENIVLFPCLDELFMTNCDKLRSAPSHFPSLKKLGIYSMDSSMPIANISSNLATLTSLSLQKIKGLDCLPDGLLKNNKNLAYLKIEECPDLSSITMDDVFGCCPSLKSVRISDCPKLRCLPDGLQTLVSLKELHIQRCSSLELQLSSSLVILKIERCPNLETIPSVENLAHLHLQELQMVSCGGLKSLPGGLNSLTSLKKLDIGGFWKELDSFPPFQVLPQLESLRLTGWSKLKSLPEQVQHLTSLKDLSIFAFEGIEALPEWLGNLASLKSLRIWLCRNLKYLPTVEAMKCLTKLENIRFTDCPLLQENCKKDGTEWPKISHIPWITGFSLSFFLFGCREYLSCIFFLFYFSLN
ncbi:disease resistance protein RGA2-like [Pyrus ussuriensis x Pyrus communis]|uniref:Disease resistance protein RGA2-like n=1 Tax=Pyrus ussuriensis x Pyrus communis TaxID=2448454 RepID=A0A5N5FMB4_9ROSA|nr:disease resistance protein RGA2-like [Pyrus ussuriensis x Pyrus communis]